MLYKPCPDDLRKGRTSSSLSSKPAMAEMNRALRIFGSSPSLGALKRQIDSILAQFRRWNGASGDYKMK